MKGTALGLAVVKHAVRQIINATVGQKLRRQHIIVDRYTAGIRVDTLQTEITEHQCVGMDIQKAPILPRCQPTLTDRLFDWLCFAGALPVIAAVMAAGYILVRRISVQNVRLFLQFMNIGIKIIVIQVTDLFAPRFTKKAAPDSI